MGILTAGKIEATFSRLCMKNEKLVHSFAVIRTSKTDFDISIEASQMALIIYPEFCYERKQQSHLYIHF